MRIASPSHPVYLKLSERSDRPAGTSVVLQFRMRDPTCVLQFAESMDGGGKAHPVVCFSSGRHLSSMEESMNLFSAADRESAYVDRWLAAQRRGQKLHPGYFCPTPREGLIGGESY
jgi:hypothetical protein